MPAMTAQHASDLQSKEDQCSASSSALAETIEDYLADCRAAGLSIKTVEDNYGYALKVVFLPWATAAGATKVTDIDSSLLMRWQSSLLNDPGKRGKPVSRYTTQGWVKSLKTFLRWAKNHGELERVAEGRGVRPPRIVLDVLSREEIERLEAIAQTERDRLIVRILADTGIRASELLGLRVGDLTERDRQAFLLVRGKGNKQRLVPVPRLGPRIERFVRGRDGERLFVALRRRQGEKKPLTLSGLQKLIRSLGREAGIKKKVHPHGFRHAFATYALSRGMNPIQLADILGHTSLVMIQRNYSHLSSRDAHDAAARIFG